MLRYVDAQYPGAALDAIVYVTVAGSAVTADKERIIMDRESDPNAYDHVTCFAETI